MSLNKATISLTHYRLAGDIAEYIRTHCAERIQLSLTHLCRQFGICETTLKNSFKYRHGVSVHQYILVVRMGQAKKYLSDEKLSVKETAWELGYTEVSNFTRDFKRVSGVTPGEWILKESKTAVDINMMG